MKKEKTQNNPTLEEKVKLMKELGYDEFEIQLILSSSPEEIKNRHETAKNRNN